MAIDKDGIKHACLQCIRGHRVKKCNHQDRPLIPLLKRGRQISQCTHCRELRSSGSHVKCTCATSTVPNPLNGCLCEVVNICTCVARHLQDTQATIKSKRSPSTSRDSPSPIDFEGVTTTAISPSITQDNPSSIEHNDVVMTAIPPNLQMDLGIDDNLNQDDFLLPPYLIQTPIMGTEVDKTSNQDHNLSYSNLIQDLSSQWITTHTTFDDNQHNSVPTTLGTITDTSNINALDLFLHQDIHDLLSL